MTVPPPSPRWPSLGPALAAGVVAAGVALPGLSLRDMGGDELWMLTGGFWEILAKALDPDAVFTGHLPLSYWARALALSVLDPRDVGSWRIHAALAAIAAAALTASLPARQGRPGLGLLAGLLLALSPLLAFHAQDSSNYAGTVLLAACLLRGLTDLSTGRGGGPALGAGLALGALNDVYSALLAGAAALISLRLWRRRPVGLGLGWALGLSVGLPVAALLALRFLGQDEAVVGLHADPLPDGATPWGLALARLRRFAVAALGGYGAGRSEAAWEAGPPLAVMALGLLAAARRDQPAWLRLSAAFLCIGLGLAVLAGLLVLLGWGRVLPIEPRSAIGLLPALSLCLAGALDRLPRGLGALALLLLVGLMGGATLQQGLNRSATQAHAAALVLAEIKPDERVVADPRVLDRLRLAGMAEGRLSSCLDADPPLGTAFWWVRLQPLDQPLDLRGCPEPSGALPQRDLSGWAPTRAWTEGPPEHERGAASFLMPAVVLRYGPDPGPGPLSLSLAIARAPLDGMAGSSLVLRDLQRPDRPPRTRAFVENEPIDFTLGDRDGLAALELRVRPQHRPGLPRLSLLDPLRQDVLQWEPVLVPVAGAPTPVLLPALALQSPWLQVGRRAAAAVLALLLGLAAVWPRRPEPS